MRAVRAFPDVMLAIVHARSAAVLTGRGTFGVREIGMALALVALALLLQRPFCELASAAVGRGGPGTAMAAVGHAVVGHPLPAPSEPETCCATIAEDVQLISAGPLVAWMSGAPTGAALFLLAALLPTLAGSRQVARIRITSPPERSFYTRSTRILR